MTRIEAQREARKAGIAWKMVEGTYRELRIQQRWDRELEWNVRQMVWSAYAYTEGSKDFWRHGMSKRFPRAFGEGDRMLIPGWDVVAQYVAGVYPQFSREGDPSEAVFDFIARPYDALPSAEDTWDEALELARSRPLAERPAPAVNDVPF